MQKMFLFVVLVLVLGSIPLFSQSQDIIHVSHEGIVTLNGTVMLKIDNEFHDLVTFLVPVGTIQAFIGEEDDVPVGWALCDGREVNIANNQALYALIGDKYGQTAESFRLPDLRGRFIRGVDTTSNGAAGQDPDANNRMDTDANTIGDVVGSYQKDQANSIHQVSSSASNSSLATTTVPDDGSWSASIMNDRAYEDSLLIRKLGGETRPTNMSVNFIIKL